VEAQAAKVTDLVLDCGENKFVVKGIDFAPGAMVIQIIRETHEAPESVARILELFRWTNRFGEPNYRAGLGLEPPRVESAGKFEDRDDAVVAARAH